MKTRKIFYALLFCILGSLASSCNKAYLYEPGAKDDSGKQIVYIDKDFARHLEVDGNDIKVPVIRNTKSGTTAVTLSIQDTSGVFFLPSNSFSFEDGKDTAYVAISYDYDKLSATSSYLVELSIADESLTSKYYVSTMPLTCKKAWKKLGKAQFYDDWFFGKIWEKELIQSPDGTKKYRLLDPFSKNDVEADGFVYTSNVPYLEFSISDKGEVTYKNVISLGFNYSGMSCSFADPYFLKKDTANEAKNNLLAPGLVRFTWYPILNYDASAGTYKWWGATSFALLSFPGGPDLNELLN